MSENSIFILLAIDLALDLEIELWAFPSQTAAESFLKNWSKDFLGGDLPPDAELVAAFLAAGMRIRFFQCDLDGNSAELTPFERVSELAQ